MNEAMAFFLPLGKAEMTLDDFVASLPNFTGSGTSSLSKVFKEMVVDEREKLPKATKR